MAENARRGVECLRAGDGRPLKGRNVTVSVHRSEGSDRRRSQCRAGPVETDRDYGGCPEGAGQKGAQGRRERFGRPHRKTREPAPQMIRVSESQLHLF